MLQSNINYVKEAKRNMIAFPKLVGLASLKWFFESDNNFMYRKDDEVSEVQIIEDGHIPESIGSRPIVVLSRGSIQFLNLAIDQRLSKDFALISGYQNIQTTHLDIVQSTLTVNCISSERVSAEYVAHSVAACFHMFSPQLRKTFELHDIRLQVLPPDSTLMGPDGLQFNAFVVPVQCVIQWPFQWQSYEKDPEVLRSMFISIFENETDFLLHLTDP